MRPYGLLLLLVLGAAVTGSAGDPAVRLMTLDPGHFHAALIQKEMYPGVDPAVHVYAPLGPDLLAHLGRVSAFNRRAENPTTWRLEVHAGPDFLERMLREKPGNVVVLSGRNRGKIDRILASVEAGLNVLADKPWLIAAADFPKLERTLDLAEKRGLVAYDVMTERSEITTILPEGAGPGRGGGGQGRAGDRGGAGHRDGERPPPHEDGGGLREPEARVVLRHGGAGGGPRRRGDAPRGPGPCGRSSPDRRSTTARRWASWRRRSGRPSSTRPSSSG